MCRLSRDYHVLLYMFYIHVCMCVMSKHDFCKRDESGDSGTMETTQSRERARQEQIKRDLQRAHDLVLLTLDVLMHSMKYD